MRTVAVILGLATGLCLNAFNASANLEVSASVQINATADFYTPLAAEGAWVDVHSYGRCWRPSHIEVGWRPYCNGEWVWTDCGWYWQSDEPWAWACYHYGSWSFEPSFGWVWVPGVEWAPAWVVWRTGGGFVGWAPCAPRGVVVAPSVFAFVQTERFHERVRPESVMVQNQQIISRTTQVTEVRRETRNFDGKARQVVFNEGPGVASIQKATRQEIKPVPVQEVDRRTQFPASVMHKTTAPDRGERPAPPLNQKELRQNEVAPQRGINPTPPDAERGARPKETAPPRGVNSIPDTERGSRPKEAAPQRVNPIPSGKEEKPRREETAPPHAVPPASEKGPRQEQTAPSRAIPPATERAPRGESVAPPQPKHPELAPRSEQIKPTPAQPRTTVEPRHQAPAEHQPPAEHPQGKGEGKGEGKGNGKEP